MAKYQTLRKEKDIAGKIRVWVDMGNEEVQILKFQKDPKAKEIKTEVDRFLSIKETDKQAELEMINQEIARLEERKKQLKKK